MPTSHSDSDAFAREMDAADPLKALRAEFCFPDAPGGDPIYMTGNSLGLMPRAARGMVEQELEDWAKLALDAHIDGHNPWLPYHEQFRGPMSKVVGALPHEVVMMNSLTVNLHLLLVSFYRPRPDRFKIVIEDTAFPSDSYAVASQASFHGFDPRDAIVRIKPREGEHTLRTEDVLQFLGREGKSVALVMLGAVNYLTGQWFEMEQITAAAHMQGCIVGWDLAHAAGNVPVRLHDWNIDFAAWCSYKYLNSGPGAVAGAYVHERHSKAAKQSTSAGSKAAPMPRFAGWWGNDPATRFKMGPEFSPVANADAWALSNPPILSLAPVKASLELFDKAGIQAIREKSVKLTGYMEFLIEKWCAERVKCLTPREPGQRGAQLSLVVAGAGRDLESRLHKRGVWVDFREPNVFRAAPTGLYNSFTDVRKFVTALREEVG